MRENVFGEAALHTGLVPASLEDRSVINGASWFNPTIFASLSIFSLENGTPCWGGLPKEKSSLDFLEGRRVWGCWELKGKFSIKEVNS